MYKLLTSYLRERYICVKIDGKVSSSHLLDHGVAVAYRNVESLGLFGYEHKVFNLKRAPPLSLTTFLPSISGLEELQSYNKFIPQVPWLKILQQTQTSKYSGKTERFLKNRYI